jgi:hypothetical protein
MIVFNYYDGVYGKTIRIATQELNDLMRIKDIFIQVINGKKKNRIDIGSLENVVITGFHDLVLEKSNQKHLIFLYQELLAREEKNGISFTWLISNEECCRCVGLIDGLIESGKGQQYLLLSERWIIEIAYNE